MCGGSGGGGGDWQPGPPDSAGDWLWLMQWGCGCVHRSGIAWATPHYTGDHMVELRGGDDPLYLSWQGGPERQPHHNMPGTVDPLTVVDWWMKLDLPTPKD